MPVERQFELRDLFCTIIHRYNKSIQSKVKKNDSASRTHIVEEFAVFSGPADLHDTGSDNFHFVVPHAVVHLECTTDTFKRWGITSCLKITISSQWNTFILIKFQQKTRSSQVQRSPHSLNLKIFGNFIRPILYYSAFWYCLFHCDLSRNPVLHQMIFHRTRNIVTENLLFRMEFWTSCYLEAVWWELQVLADVVVVQHDIQVGLFHRLKRKLTAGLNN